MDQIDIKYPIKQEKMDEEISIELDNLTEVKFDVSSDEKPEIKEEYAEEMTKKGRFECIECQNKFLNLQNLRSHIQREHGNTLGKPIRSCTVSCSRCHKTFNEILQFGKHQKRCSLTCIFCGTLFMSESALRQHEMTHTDKRTDSLVKPKTVRNHLKCRLCEKSFNEKSTLNVHEEVCPSRKRYRCSQCSHMRPTTSWGALIKHKKTHHSTEEQFSCLLCSRTFAVYEKLIAHEHKMHVSDKCKLCGKNYYRLVDHEKVCKSRPTKSIPVIRCNYCHRIFPNCDAKSSHENAGCEVKNLLTRVPLNIAEN